MEPHGEALLNIETAQALLAPITKSRVQAVFQLTNTNDVFKVTTEAKGNFYVKFHTSRWYKEAEDTHGVVQREAAVAGFIKKAGLPLEYESWTDCTRQVVGRSVLIISELPGLPLPEALRKFPRESEQILAALAHYLKRLHSLTFPRAGYIETCGHKGIAYAIDPAGNPWSDSHPCQRPENFQRFALDVLNAKEARLPTDQFSLLKEHFEAIPQVFEAEYQPPRFVVNNLHPFHFHLRREIGGWQVTGLYDFEAASAGCPTFDLMLNELQITPILGNNTWRPAFYETYGQYPNFEVFKLMLLTYLIQALGPKPTAEVPDPQWFIQQLPDLIRATDDGSFLWYPTKRQ